MAKRKKKESIAELRKRVSNDEIMDTSAGEMVLDITAKDPDVQSDGLMTTEAKLHPSDCITFYMRINILVICFYF